MYILAQGSKVTPQSSTSNHTSNIRSGNIISHEFVDNRMLKSTKMGSLQWNALHTEFQEN
jgi:hypothetical protein